MRFLVLSLFGLLSFASNGYAQTGIPKYTTVAECYGSGGIQLAFQEVFGSRFERVVVQTQYGAESFLIALGSIYNLRGLFVAAATSGHSLRIDFASETKRGMLTLGHDRQLNKSFQYKVVCSEVNP